MTRCRSFEFEWSGPAKAVEKSEPGLSPKQVDHSNSKLRHLADLADVFIEWEGLAPGDPRSALEIQETGCFDLHGLHWQESFIAADRRHRLCHYRAPDAESVRIAFRQGGIEIESAWSGTLLRPGDGSGSGVVLERSFQVPWPANAEKALARAERDWLQPLGLRPARAIVPAGRRRIICFCIIPMAGSPRLPDPAWRCRHVAAR